MRAEFPLAFAWAQDRQQRWRTTATHGRMPQETHLPPRKMQRPSGTDQFWRSLSCAQSLHVKTRGSANAPREFAGPPAWRRLRQEKKGVADGARHGPCPPKGSGPDATEVSNHVREKKCQRLRVTSLALDMSDARALGSQAANRLHVICRDGWLCPCEVAYAELFDPGEFAPLASFVSHYWGEVPSPVLSSELFAGQCLAQATLDFKASLLLHAQKVYPRDPGPSG